MLVAFTALAWAATQYKTTIKVNGTKLNVQRYVEGKGPMKDKAVLLNKDNKVVVRWKQRELKKWYYDGDKYFRFVPYSYDMKNLKPGRYRLVTTSSFGKGGEKDCQHQLQAAEQDAVPCVQDYPQGQRRCLPAPVFQKEQFYGQDLLCPDFQ